MKRYKYLLFDLDGTLTDSAPGILRSAAYALEHFGIKVDDLNDLYPFVGPPLEDSFMEFYHFSEEDALRAVDIYHKRYERKGVYENAPFDGADKCLDTLRGMGFRLALATSKPQDMTDVVIDHFGLRRHFDFIGARANDGGLRTKAEVITHTLRSLGADDLDKAVMIGDRKYDINGAKAAGIDSIGILLGYGSREELVAAGADYVVDGYESLIKLLGQPA